METQDYWFALKSHVYVEFKNEAILLYNTQTGYSSEIRSPEIISLVSQLYEPQNLGVILLDKEMQKNPDISGFIEEALHSKTGDITGVEKLPHKPVRLVPILNLQKDVDKLQKGEAENHLIGRDVIHYLLEVNIYLNDVCNAGCAQCADYCKQMHCCTATNKGETLPVDTIENILRQIGHSPVGRINISGGNILKFSNIVELQKSLAAFSDILHCYLHYKNFEKSELTGLFNLELMVNFPIDEIMFEKVWPLVNKENTTVHFIIESEDEYAETETWIERLEIEKYDVHPFYTSNNLDFFAENVFVEKEDILSKALQMREIFRNKKLNSNFFGALYILPDGTIKANMNARPLGNIKSDTLLDVIYREMLDNTAWRKVRDAEPCDACLYQFICPPPSHYETAIGKADLCHINK